MKMEFDFLKFFSVSVNGIPILMVIAALVFLIKQFGVSGKALTASSLALGTLMGGAYQYSVLPPKDFAGWFALVVYGITLGAFTSMDYDLIKGLIVEQTAKLLSKQPSK